MTNQPFFQFQYYRVQVIESELAKLTASAELFQLSLYRYAN
jgi:hypothetical protein